MEWYKKHPLCWLICNRGNKIVHYKENGIEIALHCGDHCAWKYWTVSAGFHRNNSHYSSKYTCSLSRKMYILTNQVAYLCELTVWNTETQRTHNQTVHSTVQKQCFFKKVWTNQNQFNWIFIIYNIYHSNIPDPNRCYFSCYVYGNNTTF